MAHTLKLGLKDDPSAAADDYIDLGDATPATSGYGLLDYAIGEPYADENGFQVRQITLQIEISGNTSNDTLFSRLRTLERLIERTRRYYGYFRGQFPGRATTVTYDRYAAILTFKASAATKKVYWDVMDGKLTIHTPILGSEIVNNLLQVAVTLTVAASARGEKVYLRNLLSMGDFAPPFSLASATDYPTLTCGYTTSGTWTQELNGPGLVTTVGPFQCSTPFLKASLFASTTSATLTSPAVTVAAGNVIRPQIRYFILTNSGAANCSAKMQIWNGASWSDQQTIFTANATGVGWQTASGAAYTVAGGITQARIIYTNPSSGTVKIYTAGWAIWKHYNSNDAAPTEYVTCGTKLGLPSFNVYGVQGDVAAPCVLHIENASGNFERVFVVGQTALYTDQENPVYELDFRTQTVTGGATTSLFWDNLPVTVGSGGGAATSTYLMSITHQNSGGAGNGHYLDQFPRTYRAFLMYAANDSASITGVTVTLENETRTYTTSLPQTYTGTGNAAASDYRLFDLGDYVYPRFGVPQIDGVVVQEADSAATVVLAHSSSANRRTSVGGVILLPATDSSAYINVGTSSGLTTNESLNISSEGGTPRFFITFTNNSSYQATALNSIFSAALAAGGNFKLVPDLSKTSNNTDGTTTGVCNHFSILMLRDQSATNDRVYTFNAQDTYLVWVEYFPRYLFGFR